MVEVRTDLWRSSGPTPLPRLCHPEPAAQDCVSICKEGDSTTSPTVTKCFLLFRWHLLHFSLLPLVPSLGTTETLAPSLQVFLHIDEIPLSLFLLQAEHSQCSQPFPHRRDAPVPSTSCATRAHTHQLIYVFTATSYLRSLHPSLIYFS